MPPKKAFPLVADIALMGVVCTFRSIVGRVFPLYAKVLIWPRGLCHVGHARAPTPPSIQMLCGTSWGPEA